VISVPHGMPGEECPYPRLRLVPDDHDDPDAHEARVPEPTATVAVLRPARRPTNRARPSDGDSGRGEICRAAAVPGSETSDAATRRIGPIPDSRFPIPEAPLCVAPISVTLAPAAHVLYRHGHVPNTGGLGLPEPFFSAS
jgi:hypothetical protein